MISQYENIESVKNFVCNGRMHFILKIYHLLSYTKLHDNDINIIGIFWANNDGAILMNSAILANFVGIKPNSINKNLKSYGIYKDKSPSLSILSYNNLIDRTRWIYRKSSIYSFNPNTPIEDVRNFKPDFKITKGALPQPSTGEIKTKELISHLKISSMSLLKNRNPDWEKLFKLKFSEHWLEIAEPGANAVYINKIIDFFKNCQKELFDSNPEVENKILAALCFFSNDNSKIIDIDDYFCFCSFFGFSSSIVQNIANIPFESGREISIEESDLKDRWLKMIKYDQTLLKLLENQTNETWTLCFSNEPGIYLLLNKNESIFQTQIFFDSLDNSYYIGTCSEGVKKFELLNDLVLTFLNLDLDNQLNIDLTPSIFSVPADCLHFKFQEKSEFDEIFQFD